MSRLTASVVGGGNGGRRSMEALANSDKFELVAVADLRPDALEELKGIYPGIRTFTSHKEMFAQSPTDVVCVSTYPPTHEEITLDALTLPLKGILVEKPLGHTAESGRNILKAVRAKGIPMAVPHGLLATRTPLEIIERAQNGEIGEVKLIDMQQRGGDIINSGIHWLDFCVTLTRNEPIRSVMAICDASSRTHRDGMQVETAGVTYVETESGVRMVMNTGDHVRVNRERRDTLFRIVGTLGIMEFWGWANAYSIFNSSNPNGTVITPQQYEVTLHRRHLEDMAAMADSGKPDYSVPEGSLMALEICEAAYLSSKHRCEVLFPLEKFVVPDAVEWEPGQPYSGMGGGRNGRAL